MTRMRLFVNFSQMRHRLGDVQRASLARPLIQCAIGAALAYLCLALDMGWFAYIPAVGAVVWLLMAVYVMVTGKPSPL